MGLKDYLLGAWKTFVVTGTGLVVVWLGNHGIHLSDEQATAVTIIVVAGGLSLYNLIVNWLLARTGTGGTARVLRAIGKVLTLGGRAPVYPETPPVLKR